VDCRTISPTERSIDLHPADGAAMHPVAMNVVSRSPSAERGRDESGGERESRSSNENRGFVGTYLERSGSVTLQGDGRPFTALYVRRPGAKRSEGPALRSR